VVDFTDINFDPYPGTSMIKANGVHVIRGGDANEDDVVNSLDKNNFWRPQSGNAFNYYGTFGDFNMDGVINAFDKNFTWRKNNGFGSVLD